jgi:imidazolonepropionase
MQASRSASALLLTNIGQLLTLRGSRGPRRGRELPDLGIIEGAAVLCVAGKFVSVGPASEARRDSWVNSNRRQIREVDCEGKVVVPGFVDSHTHPAFAAPRLVDFEKRIAGASYEQIAEAGGGIRSSIAGVRGATRKQLANRIGIALGRMLSEGTTTVEAKSGYGLSTESEIKSLEAIRDAAAHWPGTVISTLLGAHVTPPEFKRPADYVREITGKMIPVVARRKLAQFVDVFCDRGAFSTNDTEAIFSAALEHGLDTRAHVCQLTASALKPLLRFKPASLDHMDCVQERDIPLVAKGDTVATLVPGANYFLGFSHYPPARKLIDNGVAVALATDYNPGTSPTTSMSFVLSLACTHMKMTPAEAIAAATINGACALRLQDRKGSIEPGKDADLAIFDIDDYREIPYWVAANRCSAVVVSGELHPSSAANLS